MNLTRKLVPDTAAAGTIDWSSYRLIVTFRTLIPDPEGESPSSVEQEASGTARADGTVTLEIPELDQLHRSPPRIRVMTPAGELAAEIPTSQAMPTYVREGPSDIPVPPPPKSAAADLPTDRLAGVSLRLTGRVFSVDGNGVPNRQILIFALPRNATAAHTPPTLDDRQLVVACRSDANGYFAADYPRDLDPVTGIPGDPRQFDSAVALVAGAKSLTGAVEIPIPLGVVGGVKSVLPIPTLIVVRLETTLGDEEDECACESVVPRTPEGVDLVNASSTFSDDLGGKCITLTKPNRAIEEFSFYTVVRTTDPELLGSDRESASEPIVPADKLHAFARNMDIAASLGSDSETFHARNALSAERVKSLAVTPKLLANAMKRSPAAFGRSVAIGGLKTRMTRDLISIAGARWLLKSRNPVSGSNPIEWDGDEPHRYQATSIAHGHLLEFRQVWRADGYSLGDLLYSLPLAPGQKKQIAVVDWERREVARRSEETSFDESLSDLMVHDRDISEIVNVTLKENAKGNSQAVTGGFGQGSGAAGSGSSGGFNMGAVVGQAFGVGFGQSSASMSAARSLAADSLQKIRDTTFQAASAVRSLRSTVVHSVSEGERVTAMTEVIANHNHCHAMTIEYFEVLRHFKVTQELGGVQECLYVPLLMAPFENDAGDVNNRDSMPGLGRIHRWRDILMARLRRAQLRPAFDAIERVIDHWDFSNLPAGEYADEDVEFLDGWLSIIVRVPKPDEPGIFERAFNALNDALVGRAGQAIQSATGIEVHVGSASGISKLPVDFTLVSPFNVNTPLYVRFRSTEKPNRTRRDLTLITFDWPDQPADDPHKLPDGSQMLIMSGGMTYYTATRSATLFSQANINAGMSNSRAPVYAPLRQDERRNPRLEDLRLLGALVEHLNGNLEYYHKAIWWDMDPDRRFLLLDGFEAPNANGRSVASVVENRLIGFVGNSMILPVAPGIQLDPVIRRIKDATDKEADLLEFLDKLYRPPATKPVRISVPTRGVFAEAMLGVCNSCEHKDDARFWRWEESPIDEPTPLDRPSTASRGTPGPEAAPTPMPNSLINIHNAPPLPDPTGLGEALKVIGTPNVFRDLTGLEGNQRNALEAYKTAMETAKAFGQEASKLAQQASMKQGGIDKSLQSIDQAKKTGLIDDNQAKDLAGTALRSLVGGSPEKKEKLTEDPAVKGTLERAADKPASKVSVTRGDESVNVESTGPALTNAAWYPPEPVADLSRAPSFQYYEELQAILNATPLDLPAALDVVERSLYGWNEFRVNLSFSSTAHPGPHVQGLAGSAVYLCGNALAFVAKASTDTDGRTNNVGANPVLTTSYTVRAANGTQEALDAFADAYYVISKTILGRCGQRSKPIPRIPAGTLGFVKSYRNNTSSFAVFGDAGPCHSAGEISVALATALGYTINNPAHDSAEDQASPGVLYIVFLGTARARNHDEVTATELEAEAELTLPEYLKTYASYLMSRAQKEAPAVTPDDGSGDMYV